MTFQNRKKGVFDNSLVPLLGLSVMVFKFGFCSLNCHCVKVFLS